MDWLAFSLSNQHCLLQDVFNLSPQDPHHGVEAAERGEDGGGEKSDLRVLTAGSCVPKLEDFLGACGGDPAGRVSSGGAEPDGAVAGVLDSDLKTIAAGFLRDSPADLQEADGTTSAAVRATVEPKKAADTFGQRTSAFRGVTRHRWTGRYEAHLWDNSSRREGQTRKGRQVYLGEFSGYDKEEKAARAYDLAALKYWGPTTTTNFPVSNYEKELEEMKNMTRQEFVASLRRRSSGFSRGASMYRGVTRHHQHGRWQARIGRVAGNKDLYLGTFSTQEEAAEAYDIAAIKFRGLNAVTNFDMSRYDVETIIASNLPIGGLAGRTPKASDSSPSSSDARSFETKPIVGDQPGSSASFSIAMPLRADQQPQEYYWSLHALPQQHSQQASESSPAFNLYPSAANMEISSATATVVGQGHGGLLKSGMMYHEQQLQQQQQQQGQQSQRNGSSIPYATPVSLGSSFAAAGFRGSWVTPVASPMHAHEQPAKTSMGYLQTPIFGVE